MRKLDFIVLAAGLGVLLNGGCYPYNRHVQLSYSIPAGVGPRFDGRHQAVSVSTFLDARADRQVIGHVASAAFASSPDVTAENAPGQWIADAIRTELIQDQYNATSGDQSGGGYSIEGTVVKAFCNAAGNYVADVAFDARVIHNGQTVFARRYSGHGDRGVMVAGSPEEMSAALTDALRQAVEQFADDFHNATLHP